MFVALATIQSSLHRSHPTLTPNRMDVVVDFQRTVQQHSVLLAWAKDLMKYDSYIVGEMVKPQLCLWSVAKAIMLCEYNMDNTLFSSPVGCHCLNKYKFKPLGCKHHHNLCSNQDDESDLCAEIFPPGTCISCSKCMRCKGYLGSSLPVCIHSKKG